MFKLWVDANLDLIVGKTFVHFAPEAVGRFVASLVGEYITADIQPGRADRVLDIEHIDMPDATCDVFFCSHVLEHVDDAKALREIRRILRPGGVALLMIPIVEGWETSFEDASVVGEREREMLFGQSDHVRMYGRDFRGRVAQAGFGLEEFTAVEPHVRTYGLFRGEKVFIARPK